MFGSQTSNNEYVLVRWPESQDFMDAPGAILVLDTAVAGPSAYMVPTQVYYNYVVEEGTAL